MDDAGKAGEHGEQTRSGDEALTNSGADTMAETFMITTIEQLRVIADPLRIRILDTLVARALTVTQLGRQLGESPAKLHYHVRELERIGMVRLVTTREKEGILEKYYRAVARSFSTPPNLLQSVPGDEFAAAAGETIAKLSQNFLRAMTASVRPGADTYPNLMAFAVSSLWLKPEEHKALVDQIQALLNPYSVPRDLAGEREMTLMMMGYDAQLGAERSEESITTQEQTAYDEAPFASMQPLRRVVVVGALTYNRADLERVIAQGEQLNINVSGYCSFADDVTPDLIERAVARLRYRGVLSATPAVREALRRKEKV